MALYPQFAAPYGPYGGSAQMSGQVPWASQQSPYGAQQNGPGMQTPFAGGSQYGGGSQFGGGSPFGGQPYVGGPSSFSAQAPFFGTPGSIPQSPLMGPSPFAGGQQSFGTQTPFVPQAGFGAQTPFFGGQAPFAQGYDMLSGAWGAALQQSTLQQGIGIDDKTITEIIRDSIDLDPYIPLRDKNSIDVQASDGVVRLSGAVKSRRSKALAYLHAFACPAVTDVETQLKVEDAVTTRVQQPTSSRQTAAR